MITNDNKQITNDPHQNKSISKVPRKLIFGMPPYFNPTRWFLQTNKWKTTKKEDDQNGRQPKSKTTKMEDDQNGRWPKWKMIKMEDDLKGRGPKRKKTKMDNKVNIN